MQNDLKSNEWRKLHKEELHSSCSSLNVDCKNLGTRPLGRCRHR